MKTLTISTLALLAIACAPEANDEYDQPMSPEMEDMTEAALDNAVARTVEDTKALQDARVMIGQLHDDIIGTGGTVVGSVGGTFDDANQTFKAVGYGTYGQPIYVIEGAYTFAGGPEQVRLLDGIFVSTIDPDSGIIIPNEGDFGGEADDDGYFGMQVAAGFGPLIHEGAWIELDGTTDGYFFGLVSNR